MTVHVSVRLRRLAALALAGSLVPTLGMRQRVAAAGDAAHPVTLAIGSPAPDFSLPGIDGRTYTLASFKGSKALVVIFTAVHCPTAEIYEGRIKRLVADYQGRGVAFVAIQPNSPKALRLDEMGYTDVGDRLEDMKVRAEYRSFNFPFLYDGETQQVSRQYGPVSTPHVFVFDAARTLRYQGRLDSNPREAYAKVPDARNAIDAVLAGNAPPVEKTPTVGCSIKWLEKETLHDAEAQAIAQEAVPLEKITPEGVKALRQNTGGKTRLVNVWATWCAPCTAEFPDLQATFRMYRKRPFELVTVEPELPRRGEGRSPIPRQPARVVHELHLRLDGPVRDHSRARSRLGRQRAVLHGHRSGRQGAVQGERPARSPQSATHHPGELPRRRLRGAAGLLVHEMSV